MSLAIKYETVDDANMRLRNSIVMYKAEPVYITQIARGGAEKGDILRVLFQELPTNGGGAPKFRGDPFEDEELKRKYISSKHFDIAPFKLGYVNHPKGAFYTSRLPNRIQKQGLCAENFRGITHGGQTVNFTTFLSCKETVEMIAGRYPSFDRALQCLDKSPSVAFNRDFCLSRDEVFPELVYLYHKGKKVGYFTKNEITLGKKFICLKESLEELKVKVAA